MRAASTLQAPKGDGRSFIYTTIINSGERKVRTLRLHLVVAGL